MEASKNPLGISDPEMVARICREAATGSDRGTTLKAYEHFSSLGFSRLRRNPKFNSLGDVEKRETAYLSAGLFLKAVLSGGYQPLEGTPSEAYFWTICYRRAIDALRKLDLGEAPEEPPPPDGPDQPPRKSAFARQISLDDDDDPMLRTAASQDEQITAFLDREIVWQAVRQNLGDACWRVLRATIVEDRRNEDVWEELGFANPDSFKTRKSKCMAGLKNFVRPYFSH